MCSLIKFCFDLALAQEQDIFPLFTIALRLIITLWNTWDIQTQY